MCLALPRRRARWSRIGAIGDLADAHGKVEPVFDRGEPITHHEFDLQPRMIGEQGRQTLGEKAAGRHRDTHPHKPDR